MERHYINDYTRKELLDFHGDEKVDLVIMDTEFIRQACIDQLLSDFDADKYILKDSILYVK